MKNAWEHEKTNLLFKILVLVSPTQMTVKYHIVPYSIKLQAIILNNVVQFKTILT